MSDEESREYQGVYVAHWEVARFVVPSESKFLGVFHRVEMWRPHFPPEFELPGDRSTGFGPVRYFRMRVAGHVGPKGHFGHRGICSRELFIERVIECAPTDRPGRTW